MIFKLYTTVTGEQELVGDFEAHGVNEVVSFCYQNWPEAIEFDAAWKLWSQGKLNLWGAEPNPYPNPGKAPSGPPPFQIQYPDGSWHDWNEDKSVTFHEDYLPSWKKPRPTRPEKTPIRLNPNISCQSCKSHRVATAHGSCKDLSYFCLGDTEHDGYFPEGVGLGPGEDIELDYCLDCGQIQGKFPLPLSPIELNRNIYSDDWDEDEDDD